MAKTPQIRQWLGDLELCKATMSGQRYTNVRIPECNPKSHIILPAPMYPKHLQPIYPFSNIEAVMEATRDKKQTPLFLTRQLDIICSKISRLQDGRCLPVVYIGDFTPFGLGTLCSARTALQGLVEQYNNEFSLLKSELQQWYKDKTAQTSKILTTVRRLAELKNLQDRIYSALERTPIGNYED